MDELQTRIVKISSGVWAIDQEMVRSFLIVGTERALLFDTGAAPCDLAGMIRSLTELPLVVVHSHGDGDHTSNDGQFPDIYAHPDEIPLIRASRPELKSALHPVTGLSSFDLGGRVLKVIETPGHTPGSICLLDTQNHILFSGDTLSYGPVFMFGATRDIHTYRKTLDMLSSMSGQFDTIYPCHNTCPVSLSVISELISAVDGALDGSIQPEDGGMPMPDGKCVPVYSKGKCGILYEKN